MPAGRPAPYHFPTLSMFGGFTKSTMEWARCDNRLKVRFCG
jgi:hypothetical protein